MSGFEGDVLLVETPDGGDIVVKDGGVLPCKDFSSAVYISLFGGNKADDGKVKNNRTWWGNVLAGVREDEKVVSRFQAVVTGMPFSIKNIRAAENAARLDLEWLKNTGTADEIIVDGRVKGKNNFALYVCVNSGGKTLYEKDFALCWEAGLNGVSE